ncbi:MAG: TIGR02117 family protein [Variovorax sp.]|nr:MAG: TIGR02117 family protein [Variovorax sp.]
MRRWIRRTALLLLAPVVLLTAYVAVACVLMLWPANRPTADVPSPAAGAVEAYVSSNGVHTDLVLPIRTPAMDWTALFAPTDARAAPADAEFIAIGWGDRNFYLHTPTWADLTLPRAVSALVGGNPSLLHVTWLRRSDLASNTFRMPLSRAQYARLIEEVRMTVAGDRATAVAGAHYDVNDAFYEAKGSYHAFETCNTWTGRVMRRAGVPVSRWTPFDFNVVWHLPRIAH